MKRSRYFGLIIRLRNQLPTVAAITFSVSATWCTAQSGVNGLAVGQTSQTTQVTYEVGDVYLPSSRAYVFVGKTGFGHEHGVIGRIKQGKINLDAPRGAGSLVFDMSSFAADTPDARKFVGLEGTTDPSTQQQVNANMRGADVLDARRYPTATFVIQQIVKLPKPGPHGEAQIQLTGDFSLHGTSRPIQVVAEVQEQNGWTRLRRGFTMLQSQFGITPFTKALGAVGVTDQLTVWGEVWIAKQRQVAALTTSQR